MLIQQFLELANFRCHGFNLCINYFVVDMSGRQGVEEKYCGARGFCSGNGGKPVHTMKTETNAAWPDFTLT